MTNEINWDDIPEETIEASVETAEATEEPYATTAPRTRSERRNRTRTRRTAPARSEQPEAPASPEPAPALSGPVDTTPLNPVQAEQRITELANSISAIVDVVTERLRDKLAAKRTFERAEARATLDAEGKTVAERQANVTLEVADEQDALDVAEVAYTHAVKSASALEQELRAIQSINSNIRTMYGAAGTGQV